MKWILGFFVSTIMYVIFTCAPGYCDDNSVERAGFDRAYWYEIFVFIIPWEIPTSLLPPSSTGEYSTDCYERFGSSYYMFGKDCDCAFIDIDGTGTTRYLRVFLSNDAPTLLNAKEYTVDLLCVTDAYKKCGSATFNGQAIFSQ